jgi:F-type H+-transporting ATPase subunit alpha
MSDNRHFDRLVENGNPIGEILAIDHFLVKVRGLNPVNVHALVMFEDGSKGFVHQIFENYVVILYLGTNDLTIGMTVVVQHHSLVSKVGKDFIGRVVSVSGEPLDGKGPIAADDVWPVFNAAPPLNEREVLDTQLETGLTVIDELYPLVRGQRMALLGDSKSGKTTIATQMALNQRNTDVIVIYVLIAKRRSDIDTLLTRLAEYDAMKTAIVVVATAFESLVTNYLAPYVACALGEYLWQRQDRDVMVIYDDLTAHAQVYREIALLSGTSPGRDSYPGDMFHAHSSLLERAGKLSRNHKTFTALPLVLATSGDITAYLPTNIMSITDGQWILDMNVFRDTMRPAISVGLSVTRVGSRGQSKQQKQLSTQVMSTLNAYVEAQQFSHFGSELALAAQKDLLKGKQLFEIFNQTPSETYSITSQVLMLDIVMNVNDSQVLDLKILKSQVADFASRIAKPEDYDKVRQELISKSSVELKK